MEFDKYSKPVLRIVMSLVFLYFGYQQVTAPGNWTGFIPGFFLAFGVSAEGLVMTNAFLELGLGTLMLLGLYTRIVSLILALHLFGIAFSIGFNPLGVRDFGLASATLVVFLNGADRFCLDFRLKKSEENKR